MAEDWRRRCLRAEHQLAELESREAGARIMAQRLWRTLKARTGWEAEALFDDPEVLRIVDPFFDAVDAIWRAHRVLVEPCRQILDPNPVTLAPVQGEMYLGVWPDGSKRNLTRDQVLMMGGQEPEPHDG